VVAVVGGIFPEMRRLKSLAPQSQGVAHDE